MKLSRCCFVCRTVFLLAEYIFFFLYFRVHKTDTKSVLFTPRHVARVLQRANGTTERTRRRLTSVFARSSGGTSAERWSWSLDSYWSSSSPRVRSSPAFVLLVLLLAVKPTPRAGGKRCFSASILHRNKIKMYTQPECPFYFTKRKPTMFIVPSVRHIISFLFNKLYLCDTCVFFIDTRDGIPSFQYLGAYFKCHYHFSLLKLNVPTSAYTNRIVRVFRVKNNILMVSFEH